ncbi:MAG TPA: sodium-translocating pyrophosphatase, partial [Anaerolineae bacterium]|nr:sodium-translocating pyrophosphatase [Anaerolineae bacterium]
MDILWLGSRHGLNGFEQIAMVAVLLAAFISLAYAWWLRNTVLKKDMGTQAMQDIWNAIRIGADSYLSRQLKTILPLIGVLTVVMFLSVYVVPPSHEAQEEFAAFGPQVTTLIMAVGRTIAFIMGAFFSLTVGQWGMRMAVQANVRVAS